MKYKTININSLKNISFDCIILGIFENYDNNLNNLKCINKNKILKKKHFFLNIQNNFLIINNLYKKEKQKIILIKCGKYNNFNETFFKKNIEISIQKIKDNNYQNIIFLLPKLKVKNRKLFWKIKFTINCIENLNYKFNTFKTKKEIFNNITILFLTTHKKESEIINLAIKHSLIINKGIKKAKNLNNLPPNICNSIFILEEIKKTFNKINTKIISLNKKDMENIGMNAYLAVNKGSKNKPILSIIKYYGDKKNIKPIILIGKGLTFDSGGISLKPSKNMHEMKYDMSGAAAVYGIMYIISKLNIKLNIIGVLACAENMPGGNATRPGDIITSLSGKTIEIINTDAEGRLVLCDVLTYVQKFNPEIIIDIATLTGACLIALGDDITGLMSNNSKLAKKLLNAGYLSQDNVWELPIYPKYKKYLKSNIADIINCSEKSIAGTITAAYFLSLFVKKYKWAHLDIAGTGWNNKGATGRPINLIIEFLINYKNNKI